MEVAMTLDEPFWAVALHFLLIIMLPTLSCLGRKGTRGAFQAIVEAWLKGFAALLLISWACAELGIFHPVIILSGFVLAAVARILLQRAWFLERRMALLAFFASVVGVYALLPLAGNGANWIAGGWDPGIYVNEGARLLRTGSLDAPAPAFFEVLSGEERTLFTRHRHGFEEYLPVTPLAPDYSEVRRFFFPLTAVFLAWCAWAGGIVTACHAPLFLLPPLFAALFGLMAAAGVPVRVRWMAPALFFLLPVTLYHLSVPTSELLEVCLLFALFAHLFSAPRAAWVGVFVLLAVLNRMSFFTFSGMLMSVWCLVRLRHASPRRETIGILAGASLAAGLGLGIDLAVNPDATARLADHLGGLVGVGIALHVAAWGIVGVGVYIPWLRRVSVLHAATFAGCVLFGLRLGGGGDGRIQCLFALEGAQAYLGLFPLIFTGLSLLALLFFRARLTPESESLLAFFLIAAVLVIVRFEIAPQYPWASRRFLLYLVPCVVLMVPMALSLLPSARHSLAFGLAVLAFIGLIQGRTLIQAARVADYPGLASTLAAVARQVPSNALVVCDHFLWATPLYNIHGIEVINGEALWSEDAADAYHLPATERTSRAWALLGTIARSRPVYFFTSTEKGDDVYKPTPPGILTPVGDPVHHTYTLVRHHRAMRDFKMESRTKIYTLWQWSPQL